MTAAACPALCAAAKGLTALDIPFALVHESAVMAWGMDSNAFLDAVDALLPDKASFGLLGCELPHGLGGFSEAVVDGVPVRLWSRESLGLEGPFDVTLAARYCCECLAPEIVLAKIPYSPDARLLHEQRARLAAVVNADVLTNAELELFASLVRGA